MENSPPKTLEERIERLEKALFRIERVILRGQKKREEERALEEKRLAELAQNVGLGTAETANPEEKKTEQTSPDATYITERLREYVEAEREPALPLSRLITRQSSFENILGAIRNTEDWFNKIGMALLLFGLAFLFNYAVDEGWLTPTIRVLIGTGLGVVLTTLGFRLFEKRRRFSLFLFGGGIVSFYISGFAAYQLFGLISFPLAFGLMIAVTVTSFLISVRLDEAVPSFIACIGGFATPFLLYNESSNVPGLMWYVSLMIVGSVVVYWFRGWRPLLWLSFVSVGSIFLFTVSNLFAGVSNADFNQQLPLQLGIVFAWLVFGVTPIAREVFSHRSLQKLRHTVPGFRHTEVSDRTRVYMEQHVFIFTPLLGGLAMAVSAPIWEFERQTWGIIILVYALVYSLAGAYCWSQSSTKIYAPAHLFSSILFLTVGLFVLFENNALVLSVTFELMILHGLASRYENKNLSNVGHIIAVLIILLMIDRFGVSRADGIQMLSLSALTDLVVLVCGFLVSRLFSSDAEKKVYRTVVHAGLLAWLLHELAPGQNGQALVSISWGVYASLLLIVSLRLNDSFLRRLSIATLGIIVLKLFLVDLARLEMIWRVIVFTGFGGGFLLLSYFFRSLWRTDPPEEEEA